MYPRMVFDSKKYAHNVGVLKKRLAPRGISLTIVTKVYCAMPEVAGAVAEHVDYFGDSRLLNIKKLQHINKPKMLIRIPMMSETADVVRFADISFNSELDVVRRLDEEAGKQGKKHKIVVMKDVGDLREGYFEEKLLFEAVEKMLMLKNIEVYGLGTNLTCFGAILPSRENNQQLVDAAREIERRFSVRLPMISGGASTSVSLSDRGEMPEGINNLRVGEFCTTGWDSANEVVQEDMYQDVFTVEAEIVELKEKPSIPIGEPDKDAFAEKPTFIDRGVRKRAIAAIGRQDTDLPSLLPLDEDMIILGASSDHLLLDVSDCAKDYKPGDIVRFKLRYVSILRVSTSPYVEKVFI